MSNNLNLAIIIGRLGKDPELRHTASQKSVCTLNVATTERWKDAQGQKQESTTWHRVRTWGPVAENCAMYLKKGSLVHVLGKITTRSYEENGVTKYVTEIKADEVGFLSPSPSIPPPAKEQTEEVPF